MFSLTCPNVGFQAVPRRVILVANNRIMSRWRVDDLEGRLRFNLLNTPSPSILNPAPAPQVNSFGEVKKRRRKLLAQLHRQDG